MLNNNALELAVADAGLQGQQVFVPDSVCFDKDLTPPVLCGGLGTDHGEERFRESRVMVFPDSGKKEVRP